jgi:hypothetical protein
MGPRPSYSISYSHNISGAQTKSLIIVQDIIGGLRCLGRTPHIPESGCCCRCMRGEGRTISLGYMKPFKPREMGQLESLLEECCDVHLMRCDGLRLLAIV